MSGEQLCFFKFARPLVDLLGVHFFRAVPREPGVYVFYGERRRVLYVGQSKNLRQRLAYYKNAQPEREPRRIIRMVHQTRALEFQTCASAAAAEARELELIQEHQPRFNVRHALSRTYSFFGLRRAGERWLLRLSLEATPRTAETLIGAFKNRGLCRRAFFAMARTHWCAAHPVESIYGLPLWLVDRTKLNEVTLPEAGEASERVTPFLKGDSDQFLRDAEANLARAVDVFLKALFASDLVTLTEFFVLAARMKELRLRSGIDSLLPQREVDRVQLASAHERAQGGDWQVSAG